MVDTFTFFLSLLILGAAQSMFSLEFKSTWGYLECMLKFKYYIV